VHRSRASSAGERGRRIHPRGRRKPEGTQSLGKGRGFRLKRTDGGVCLLEHGGILLRCAVKLVRRVRNLADPGGGFRRSDNDLADLAGDILDPRDDLIESFARVIDEVDPAPHVACRVFDQVGVLARGIRRPAGPLPDFRRDNGKATAGFPRARGLDRPAGLGDTSGERAEHVEGRPGQ
jgi:hypothetical protein